MRVWKILRLLLVVVVAEAAEDHQGLRRAVLPSLEIAIVVMFLEVEEREEE
jgi:hypothetical protein